MKTKTNGKQADNCKNNETTNRVNNYNPNEPQGVRTLAGLASADGVKLYTMDDQNPAPTFAAAFRNAGEAAEWLRRAAEGTGALSVDACDILSVSSTHLLYYSNRNGRYILDFVVKKDETAEEVADLLRHRIDDARKWRMTVRIGEDITKAVTSAPAAAYVMTSRRNHARQIIVTRQEGTPDRLRVIWATGDEITRTDENRTQKQAAALVLAFFDEEDGERCAATGTPIYSVSEKSETDAPATMEQADEVYITIRIAYRHDGRRNAEEARREAAERVAGHLQGAYIYEAADGLEITDIDNYGENE